MDKKYELTDETKIVRGHTVYRIRALKELSYTNKVHKGELGGWVESERNLRQTGHCWIYDEAVVYDRALIVDNAQILDNAIVRGISWVSDNAKIYGNAEISNNAWIAGNAEVFGKATVSDSALVLQDSQVYGNAKISGDAQVLGNVRVCEEVLLQGSSTLSGNHKITQTPLQIRGSRDFVNVNGDKLQIGDELFTVYEWYKYCEKIDLFSEYSRGQIEEYKLYIDLARKWMETN